MVPSLNIGQPVSAKRRKPVHKTALKDSALHTPNDSYQAQIALEPIEASKKVHVEAIRFFIFPGTWRKAGGAKAKGNIIDEEYKEGIYVGYRWADKEKNAPYLCVRTWLKLYHFCLLQSSCRQKTNESIWKNHHHCSSKKYRKTCGF